MEKKNKLPNLEKRFLPPDGWQWGSFENNRGKTIRYGFVMPENPSGIVVGLQGLSEYGEKYFEVANDLLKRNLGFFMMDWQGQGLSDRYLDNPHKRHADDFENDVEDFSQFVNQHVKPNIPDNTPLIMLGHSMGANIGMRYLAEQKNDFSCAAFTAPMLRISLIKNIPNWFLLIMNKIAEDSYATLKGGDWTPDRRNTPSGDIFSDDPVRKLVHNAWKIHDPRLQIGDVTFGWVYHAGRSCDRLNEKDTLRNINIPCLAALSGNEKLVDNLAAKEVFNKMANASFIDLPGSKHEILMERDSIRNRFFKAFDDLLAKTGITRQPPRNGPDPGP